MTDYDPRYQRPVTPPQWQQGQVQPWQPPQAYAPQPYYPQQYGLPQTVRPRSPGTGLVLGLVLPGAGCMYAGRPGIGILILALWLISIPLVFVMFIGVLTGFACWVISAVLGWTMTRDWNAARGVMS